MALRRELIERACRQVSGRVPTLVGVTDTSFSESMNLARSVAESGAQAVVASAPDYFAANQLEPLQYLKGLSSELPLPLFLYDAPSRGVEIFLQRRSANRLAGWISYYSRLHDAEAGIWFPSDQDQRHYQRLRPVWSWTFDGSLPARVTRRHVSGRWSRLVS